MGSYVIRMKILPEDTTTDLESLLATVAGLLPNPVEVRGHRIEPIAFGLSAIIADIVAPEEEGMVDKIEEVVSKAPKVSQYEVVAVSRTSAKLPGR
jgi:elongation factor 1-beta